MNKIVLVLLGLIVSSFLSAQNIAINTTGADPDGSAMLDIGGTNHGLLVPRVALTATGAAGPVTSPAVSLLVYNTATISDVTPGYYYWNGSAWVRFFDTLVNSADHDWYEVGGTDAPNSINDNIFTQGNVGVGIATPSEKLHVGGVVLARGEGVSATAGGMQFAGHFNGSNVLNTFGSQNGGHTVIGYAAKSAINTAGYISSNGLSPSTKEILKIGNGFEFMTSPHATVALNSALTLTSVVKILNNGNVGIGTTNPKNKLHIYDQVDGVFSGLVIDNRKIYGSGTGTNEVSRLLLSLSETGISDPNNRVMGYIEGGTQSEGSSANGYLALGTRTSGTETEKMRILANGNVGLGTTSPLNRLHVVENGNSVVANFESSSHRQSVISFTGSDGVIGLYAGLTQASGGTTSGVNDGDVAFVIPNGNTHDMHFSVNGGVPELSIDGGTGNVGIGTTAPNDLLHLNNGSGQEGEPGIFIQDPTTNSDFGGRVYYDDKSGADALKLSTVNNNIESGYIALRRVDGNVGIGTTTPNEKLEINGSIRITDGNEASGRILVSDANGTGSWQDASAISPSSMEDADGDTRIQVEESTDDDDIRFDTKGVERMIIDSTGKIGIGTLDPFHPLHVKHPLANSELLSGEVPSHVNAVFERVYTTSSAASIAMIGSDTLSNGEGRIYIGNSDLYDATSIIGSAHKGLQFFTRDQGYPSLERLRILHNGNVGIGTTSPLSRFEVTESSNVSGWAARVNNTGTGGANSGLVITSGDPTNTSGHIFLARANDNSERFTIKPNGNVGIGTSAPASKLHIGATTATHPLSTGNFISATSNSGDNKPVAYFETGGNAIGEPAIFAYGRGSTPITDVVTISANGTSNSNYNLLNLVHGETVAGGDGTSVMVVKGSGNVGIGTTTPDGSLHILPTTNQTDAPSAGIFLGHSSSGDKQIQLSQTGGVPHIDISRGGSADYDGRISVPEDGRLALGTSSSPSTINIKGGNVGIGTTTPSEKLHVIGNILASGTITSSDERYKKDVKGVENASAIIEKLRPVSYLFKTEEFEGQFDHKRHYGVIAQEIEKVLPELVYTDDKGFKAVNYTDLISVLLKGIQEQQSKSEDQEQKLSDQEKQLLGQEQIISQNTQELAALKLQIEELKQLILKSQNIK